jgi:ribosomal protein S18 acetylase RimI-like enzyme
LYTETQVIPNEVRNLCNLDGHYGLFIKNPVRFNNSLDLFSEGIAMMIIRKAVQEDIGVIAGFQQKMAMETENLSLDESLLINGVGNVFRNPSLGFYLIAQDNDRVIASMLLTPEWSDWRNSLFLWIQSLYVIPEYRKKGVFRMMYEHVRRMVQDSGDYAGLKLYVDESNTPAQKTYRQVGMRSSHYRLFEWNKFDY